MNAQINAYISGERAKGTPIDTIKQNLKVSGWNDQQINEAFGALASPPISSSVPFVSPRKSGSAFKVILIIILILLLVGAGIWFFYFRTKSSPALPQNTPDNTSQSQATVSPSSSAEPSKPAVSDPTVGVTWKPVATYTNKSPELIKGPSYSNEYQTPPFSITGQWVRIRWQAKQDPNGSGEWFGFGIDKGRSIIDFDHCYEEGDIHHNLTNLDIGRNSILDGASGVWSCPLVANPSSRTLTVKVGFQGLADDPGDSFSFTIEDGSNP